MAVREKDQREKVVIVGGGFGGLTAARQLQKSDLEVVLIDKKNHHLFQPLLYQVAVAALSPGEIAEPLRSIFKGRKNIKVIMGEVTSVDREKNCLHLKDGDEIDFDYLLLAPGSRHSYFGNSHWEDYARGLKTVEDALNIRENLLYSFEKAEIADSEEERKSYLTFVIIGGGPTGVEMAGAISEIAQKTMMGDFRNIDPSEARIVLLEASKGVLNPYPQELSKKAEETLKSFGVEVQTGEAVTEISDRGVEVGGEWIETRNVIWAAGNECKSPLLDSLEAERDRGGRVKVQGDLSLRASPHIFVIGDAAHCVNPDEEEPLPGLAPVAIQQGKYLARILKKRIPPQERSPFVYKDRGMMAAIGRSRAVASINNFHLSGTLAWLVWAVIHIFFLIGFRNRLWVMSGWIWYYFTSGGVARLITDRVDSSCPRKCQSGETPGREEKEEVEKSQNEEGKEE